MRLVCPSCEAAYDVPDSRLGTGPRRVRCARCQEQWTFEPPAAREPEPLPPPVPLPLRASASVGAAGPPLVRPAYFPDYEEPPVFDRPAVGAWIASLVILAGLGFAAATFRAEITHVWPPSERAYALFGGPAH